MRWSIIRLIWLRELRDQLRDRRTVFMIAVLPILLYPVAGFGFLQMALGYLGKQTVLGVQGQQYLPQLTPRCTDFSPVPVVSWFTVPQAVPGIPLNGMERLSAAAALEQGTAERSASGLSPALSRRGRQTSLSRSVPGKPGRNAHARAPLAGHSYAGRRSDAA